MNSPVHDRDAVRLVEITQYYWITQAVGTFAKLGVADAFGATPATADDLASQIGCDAVALQRLLRSLTGVGMVMEREGGAFELTPMGALLRRSHPASMHKLATLQIEPWLWQVFQQMPRTVRKGTPGVHPVLGVDDYWTYLEGTPDAQAAFNEGMTAAAQALQIPVALAYDYASVRHVVDVGGGLGHVLAAVLQENPHLHGTLFDLQATVPQARKRFDELGVGARCATVAGDMFKEIPAGADAYLLSFVLMDWDDERASLLLRNLAAVLPNEARVLVVDCLLDLDPSHTVPSQAGHAFHLGRTVDLFQLCMGSARVRTRQEFADLAEAAGLRLAAVIQPRGPVSLLELTH